MQRNPPWHLGELLAFDLETTGVDQFSDLPVSFALVRMVGGMVESLEAAVIDPGRPIPEPATAVHGITDQRVRREGIGLEEGVAFVARALLDASRRGVPVVGMKVDFDLTMIDSCHWRTVGFGLADAGFVGPVLDALVLDRHFDRFRSGRRTLTDLCAQYGVVLGQAHDARADARAALDVVLSMCRRYPELCTATPDDLHWSQMEWHRDWARSLATWFLRHGIPPIDDLDAAWPIASRWDDLAQLVRAAG